MNLKTITQKLVVTLTLSILGFGAFAQQPGCFLIPDLDGYKRAYKMNYGGAQNYKEFYKAYKDSYLDTAYYVNNSLKSLAPQKSDWRLTDQIGAAAPYCGGLKSKLGLATVDENMFLKGGVYNNLEVDKFLGKKKIFGLGALGGYTKYFVDENSYTERYRLQPFGGQSAANNLLIKSKPYEVFYLLLGPVATFNLGKKLNLDLTVKAGPAHSDVAYVGANNRVTGQVLHRAQPNEDRWSLGGNAGVRLMYKIAERWKVGVNANAFSAGKVDYETLDPIGNNSATTFQTWTRTQANFNGGIALQHIWPEQQRPVYIPLNRLDPPVAAPVAVAPSLNNPCDQVYTTNAFNNSFNWTSNDNLEDKANEMFVFKLYKVPSKEPILVKTQKENTLTLDSPLPVPTDVCSSDEYYYTVHSTKGASFSELVSCSFKIKNAAAASANCSNNNVAVAEVASGPVYLTRILGNESYTRQIVKYDEGKGCKCPIDTLTRTGTKLIEYYKQYSNANELSTWPDGLPIPKKANGFIYEVRQVYDAANEGQKAGSVTRYRLDVDRRTRAVTMRPMSSRKR